MKSLADLDLAKPDVARKRLEEVLPVGGREIKAVEKAATEGADMGWLLPQEQGGVRFGRLAKDLGGFSIDAVWMDGPGPRHRHGNGEIDLCFIDDGRPRFCGKAPGWVVYGPGSEHVPEVTGGSMLILYFLPKGAIEFL